MNGITICPDCQLALVETRPSSIHAAVSPDDSWIEVCGVRNNSKAQAAKSALDSSNVPSVLLSSRFLSSQSTSEAELTDATNELTVIMVPREFRDEAEVVVESMLGDDFIPFDDL
jgi:hypothetical protein